MDRRVIAALSNVDPHGGGSHQWTLNILHSLNDYRAKHADVDVVILHYRAYPGGHPLRHLFPEFRYVRIGALANLMARLLRRLTVAVPRALPLLRLLFPLNRVAGCLGARAVLFPVTSLDSALCNIRNIFCMADIAHIYYPQFPEVSANNQLRLRNVLFRYGVANADLIMVESQELKREVGKHYAADLARVHVIHQVLPRGFQISPAMENSVEIRKPYIFYPAQLWAHKNHLNLLTAFAAVCREVPELRLVLSGSRKQGDEVIFARIQELGLVERVHYLGYVSDERMPGLYANAAALVMPTYFGPTNIPTLEAFAFGCPAVISDLPGVEEQVGSAALRFDPDDPVDMAEKICRVLKDPSLADRLVAGGRARLRELSYENFRDAMFRLFDGALASRAG